jgi:hypothetical protein
MGRIFLAISRQFPHLEADYWAVVFFLNISRPLNFLFLLAANTTGQSLFHVAMVH